MEISTGTMCPLVLQAAGSCILGTQRHEAQFPHVRPVPKGIRSAESSARALSRAVLVDALGIGEQRTDAAEARATLAMVPKLSLLALLYPLELAPLLSG